MFNRIKEWIMEIIKSRLFVTVIAFCVLFAILIQRVFYLQIVKGQYYLDNYKLQIRKTREVPGTRGNIYDRNGELLAYNELAYSVTIEDNGDYSSMTLKEKNKIINETVEEVIDIVESNGDTVISDFGIILNASGNYEFAAQNETSKLRFLADIYGYQTIDELTDKEENASADDIINYLCEDERYGYGIDQSSMEKSRILKMVNIRYAISLNSFQKYIPTTIASNVSDETVAEIMENSDRLQGVNIAEDSLRRYTDSKYFASLIGYTGKISQEEYNEKKESSKEYTLTDIVGKSGLEQTMDEELQGTKGKEIVYVDSVGNVIETEKKTDAVAGNDLYLTIDKNLQEATYQIIEEKLAGILVSRIQNIMNYDPASAGDSSKIIIPIDDVYHALFANEVIDTKHFSSADAKETEKKVAALVAEKKASCIAEVMSQLRDPAAASYKSLSKEMQAYMNYIADDLLMDQAGILSSDAIDTSDKTYIAWTKDETISLYEYLNYAISKNWINLSEIPQAETEQEKYSDLNEIYGQILTYLEQTLPSDSIFEKLVYRYMIKANELKGKDICRILYEQNVIAFDEGQYQGLESGQIDPYSFLVGKISSLEITPAQLALEPCSGSTVVTDVNTGEVLACVSYPGYDNNRLANTMDSAYYNKLANDLSSPFYNTATQERTAPGSTYKMLTSVAALTEGIITPSDGVVCEGIFEKVFPNPKCWISPGAHGWLDVTGALQHSCNIFYYEMGYELGVTESGDKKGEDGKPAKTYSSDLGIEKLTKYAEMFGLNEKSGLEISESKPQISDTDSVLSAIGQGTNNYTTSQLARYVTAVANRGKVFQLSLLDKTVDKKGNVVKDYQPELRNEITEVSDSTWNAVQQGMEDMVSTTGTFDSLRLEGFQMAGKTGTAQQSETHPDHALFVGYAPSENPEIAVSVRIANGYNSSYTAEIGRDIVKYKYHLGDTEDIVTGSASMLGVAGAGD
ncbi:penicillin-binding transpeptidase domain-containing protein [Faecalimonas umbilicata]|uniref:penicillin-binding transpeptidase domain-containing protein n=1 Tax=Faecalimonas umbilicata TaxID=1912855 RepID=UPI000E400493|nr:penicillin-binding transpeptidase domain-containing protein [Faecalimonas umbilicata]RGC79187.1 penicillin-binding protein [Lachnospiraceae bacterium AM25-17]RJU64408.1 penicillin-binding protein [Coprococcus sp. AM27-12LB]